MKQKQTTTGNTEGKKRPFWRVRRRDQPNMWLRNFDTEAEARDFARQHAIEHCCDMWMQRVGEPLPVIQEDDWEF